MMRIALALLVVGAIAIAGERLAPHLPEMEEWVRARGALAPVLLCLMGVLLSLFCLPLDLVGLAAGAVFGLGKGAIYAPLALYLGQTTAYLIGRYLLAEQLFRWSETHPRLKRLRAMTVETHPGLLILLRASPLPTSPVAYLLGASRLPLRTFLIANLGVLPQCFVVVFFGYASVHTSRLLHDPNHATLWHNLLVYGGLAMVGITVAWFAHRARRRLHSIH